MRKRNIKTASLYTIIGKFVSKILGLIRERLTKTLFGLSPEMSIFSFIITLVGLIRSTTIRSFIKVGVSYAVKHQDTEKSVLSSIFTIISGINLLVGTLLIVFSPYLAHYTLGNLVYNRHLHQFGTLMYIAAGILIIVLSFSDTAEALFSGFRIFTFQIIREPLINTVYIGTLLVIPSTYMLMGGRLIGEILFMALVVTGFAYIYRSVFSMPSFQHIKTIFMLSLPVVMGTSINFINTFVDRYMATLLPDTRSVSALAAATTVAILPYAIFGDAITRSVYTGFAEAGSRGDMKQFANYIGKVLHLGGLLIIPASTGIAVLSDNLTYFLYFGGKFTDRDVVLVSYAMMFYAIRYLATSLYIPLNNSLITLNKGHISMWLATIFVPINILLNWFLGFHMDMEAPGFALATAITSTLMLLTTIVILTHIASTAIPAYHVNGFIKATTASIIMGSVIYLLKGYMGIGRIYTILLIVIGMLIYAISLIALRERETLKILNKVMRRKSQ